MQVNTKIFQINVSDFFNVCITSLSLQLIMGYIMTIFSDFFVPIEFCFNGQSSSFSGAISVLRHRWSIQKLFKSRQAILVNHHGPPLPKIEVAFLSAPAYILQTNYRIRTRKNIHHTGFKTSTLSINRRP